jgi:hypothetical protein
MLCFIPPDHKSSIAQLHVSEVYGFALFGLDTPFALPCLARFCTPDMVGGVVILPSMSHLV